MNNTEVVKAISLWEPWAILIPLGEKEFETRSWRPPQSVMGCTFVIHAAKFWDADTRRMAYEEFIHTALVMHGYYPDHLPLGAAVGTARLVGYDSTEVMRSRITIKEQAFGNYSPFRFAWRFTEPRLFDKPIPYKGKQGIWNWDLPLPELEKA